MTNSHAVEYLTNYCKQALATANSYKNVPEATQYHAALVRWKERVEKGEAPDWLDIEKIMKRSRHISTHGFDKPGRLESVA